jgi:hypothetical protein
VETQDIAFATVFSLIAIFFALVFLAPSIAQPIIESFVYILIGLIEAILGFLARLIFGA